MAETKEQFSGRAAPELLAAMRSIAQGKGWDFEATLEGAMHEYVANQSADKQQPDAVAHFRHSLERNRRLYELLAQ